ncbi:MAG: hypothetical protein WBN88_02950, partial [Anderseniella sp.]
MTTQKSSRNNSQILDLYAAGTLMEASPASEVVSFAASVVDMREDKNMGEEAPAGIMAVSPKNTEQVGSAKKEKPDAGETQAGSSTSEWASMSMSKDQSAVLSEGNEPATGTQMSYQSESSSSQQLPLSGDTLNFKADLQAVANNKSNTIKTGFETPGGPTHHIDGDNLEDLMAYLDWGQWGGQVWDSWSGMEVTVLTYRFPQAYED